MDEPAQCFAVAYAAAAGVVIYCCSMEKLWTVAQKNFNLCVERIWGVQKSTMAEWIVYYINTSSYEDFLVFSSGIQRKFGECWQSPTQKCGVGIQFVSP